MSAISFTKMHGLGNDFVVIDGRGETFALAADQARTVADRHLGVGCDQVITIEPPKDGAAHAFMRIRNADGGEVGACGNAARCVAALLMKETGRPNIRLETASGILEAENSDDSGVTVDMGAPKLEWSEIPLSEPADTLRLDLEAGPLRDPAAVSMGNPHAVFFVEDVDAINLAQLGPRLEHHRLFPERANIGIAQVLSRETIRLRVWERGAGITQACGTGAPACAAVVARRAANRRGLTARAVSVTLDGGGLQIEWREDDHVMMTGPVAVSFTGILDEALIA